MGRIIAFLYGAIAYVIFFISILYAIGFVGNFLVPKSIDSGPETPFGQALLVNALLLGLFAIQHTIMARPGFKRWWTQIIPKSVERSTFVLVASLLLLLLYWQWRPIGGMVWEVKNSLGQNILYAIFVIGWVQVFLSTFLINHFDLFGLRQVFLNLRKKEYKPLSYVTPMLYGMVRHPLMLGLIIAFWATPMMSLGHLIFAIGTTLYILVGIQFEERDLITVHGKSYENYRQQVPMLVPFLKGGNLKVQAVEITEQKQESIQ